MGEIYFLATLILAPILFPFVRAILRRRWALLAPFLTTSGIIIVSLMLEDIAIDPFLISIVVWALLAVLVWKIVAWLPHKREDQSLS
ncbi:hypothetical protein HY229_09445 [Candidatus Acetothermia bacterium]|nr:hypothetical protein [Candidatus Acetothermia bacterium]MBI3644307.1 hypothetical protein [Candidatus Acetothermia bacterium]